MTPIKRGLVAVSAPILLAFSLSACGGGAPTDASEEDFCEAFQGGEQLDAEASEAEQIEAIKDSTAELEEVGTPESISEDERAGFEIYIEALGDLDEDTFKELMESEDSDEANDILGISNEESDSAEAFNTYASDTCA